MRSPIAVRQARTEDFGAWKELWDGYNAFYGRSGSTALAPEITQTTWSRFFDAYEPVNALVAESDGGLIGLVHYIFHRNTTMLGPVCYLQDLFTTPAARGQGVGRALILEVYDRARTAGSTRVYWLTQETNTVAMRLYDQIAQKSGFIMYRQPLE
ncbi:MAG: GNAT family N-acetyltransferase [Steroidobacteraceae bacterium]|jgi:GNAT superfamily N-acetyltransferase